MNSDSAWMGPLILNSLTLAVCQLDFAVAAVDSKCSIRFSSNPVAVLVQVLPFVVAKWLRRW